MKIRIIEGGLILLPETEFEELALVEILPHSVTHKAFIKTGLSPAEIVGLRIERKDASKK